MPMKRALSILFIFLMITSGIITLPVSHAVNPTENFNIYLYDGAGRFLDTNNSAVKEYLKVQISAINWLGLSHVLFTIQGQNPIHVRYNWGSKILVTVYWINAKIYKGSYVLNSKDIRVNMPVIPAIPINNFQIKTIGVSSDLHEISTAYYNVQFGVGTYQNEIQISIGANKYIMPVQLQLNYQSSSDNKPFRFLAQNTNGVVTGEDKFLIWTTGKYFSAVRTTKVGDGMFLMVWTYGYADVAGAWVSKVIAATLAGAVLGATTGPEGALMGGAIGGMASAIAWAVNPNLINLKAHTGIGVIAAIFTPKWFMIQGAGGFGSNETKGTIEIENMPSSGRATYSTTAYEIYSQSNMIQFGFTKDYGSVRIIGPYDFETQEQYNEWAYIDNGGRTGWSTGPHHSGQYSVYLYQNDFYLHKPAIHLRAGDKIKVTFDFWYTSSGSGYYYEEIFKTDSNGNEQSLFWKSGQKQIIDAWTHVINSIEVTAQNECNVTFGFTTINTGIYIDDIKFSVAIMSQGKYRYIFDTSQSGSNVVRYMFNTIPTYAPNLDSITTVENTYTLIAIDMTNRHGLLALDWESRIPDIIVPARIIIKTDTWRETAWILSTNDKEGFYNVSFVITDPSKFVYEIDPFTYYYFTGPDNWTYIRWSSLIANNTTIYIPTNFGLPSWVVWNWQLNKWWQNIGPWAHLALLGLAAFIIFIIILIVAPWLIFALIKILGLILKAIFTAIGMAAKGAGKMLGKRRHKK